MQQVYEIQVSDNERLSFWYNNQRTVNVFRVTEKARMASGVVDCYRHEDVFTFQEPVDIDEFELCCHEYVSDHQEDADEN